MQVSEEVEEHQVEELRQMREQAATGKTLNSVLQCVAVFCSMLQYVAADVGAGSYR